MQQAAIRAAARRVCRMSISVDLRQRVVVSSRRTGSEQVSHGISPGIRRKRQHVRRWKASGAAGAVACFQSIRPWIGQSATAKNASASARTPAR